MRQNYFFTPFAASGDTNPIPIPTQSVTRLVSYTIGWSFDYERDLATDALALPIDRQNTNYLFNVITQQLQQYQQYGTPEWIDSTDNQGMPFAYDFGARVRYSVSGNPPFLTYTSTVPGQATNTSTPGSDANWKLESVGGMTHFSALYSAAIGGYPQYAVLQSNDGKSLYMSTSAANTTDFNSTPSSIPSLWYPIAGDGLKAAANNWPGPQQSTAVPIAVVSNVCAINLSLGNNFVVGGGTGTFAPLAANLTVNFTVATSNYGQSGAVEFIQDATGGRTITAYSSNVLKNNGAYANLTGTASHRDTMTYYVNFDGKVTWTAVNNQV